MILDYTDFVEQACQEANGVYSSYPSTADVLHAALRYIDPSEKPVDPLAVTQEEFLLARDRWMDFVCCRWNAFGEWFHLNTCPLCRIPLEHSIEPSHLTGDILREVSVRCCLNCGWWDMEEVAKVIQEKGSPDYVAPSVHRRSLLRQFDVSGSDIPIASLRNYLTRHPETLSNISPRALEKLVGDVFGETMNCEAIHVGGPNDGGIDVVLVQGARRYVIQTKRRSGNAAESVNGIREFVGAMLLAGEMKGIFVTTAPKFSESAKATASLARRRGIVDYIELVAPKKLLDVCKLASVNAQEQWEKVRSQAGKLNEHMNFGENAFMEIFMGHPNWKVVRTSRSPKENKKIVYRYFKSLNEPHPASDRAKPPSSARLSCPNTQERVQGE
jgi:hypothetical protein